MNYVFLLNLSYNILIPSHSFKASLTQFFQQQKELLSSFAVDVIENNCTRVGGGGLGLGTAASSLVTAAGKRVRSRL